LNNFEAAFYLNVDFIGQVALLADLHGEIIGGARYYIWSPGQPTSPLSMAVGLEDGDISEAQAALRAAQEALRNALDRGAGDQELKQLMDQLRAAMDRFMQAMQSSPLVKGEIRSASVVLSIVACSFGGRRSQASSRATFRRAIVWASKWAAAFAISQALFRPRAMSAGCACPCPGWQAEDHRRAGTCVGVH
jgi:hypothetical protein